MAVLLEQWRKKFCERSRRSLVMYQWQTHPTIMSKMADIVDVEYDGEQLPK